MGKLMRILGFTLGGLLLVVVLAVIVLPLVIDPNDFKEDIATAVESNTGRALSMEGDLGLSVFPWLGLEIGSTALSNAPGFSGQPFAKVEAVQVRVKLLPLLRKELEMDTVILKGLQLSLETNAQGKTNWEDLAGAAEEAPPEEEEQPSATGVAVGGLAIGGVELTDAGVVWDDQSSGARYEVKGVSLRTGAIAPGEAVPIELKLELDSREPQVSGPVEFAGTVALSDDSQIVEVKDASLSTGLKGEGLPGGQLKSALGFNTTLNLETQQLELSDLLLKVLGLQLEGSMKGTQLFGDAAFNGQFKIREFVPREVIQALGLPLPEVSDPSVLGKADAAWSLAATKDSASVKAFQLRLDDSTLKGDLSVSQFANPVIRYGLHLDKIDVDRYLPPRGEEPATPVTPTAAAAAGTQLIPVETLRTLNVNGKVTIDSLKAAQLRSADVVMQLVAKNGLVRVHPASANMYKGQYQGDITLDVRGKQPKISMNEQLSGVQVGPLLKDMTGEERLLGTTQASARLTTVGQTPDEFKKTLNGNLSFAFTDGAVKGFNLAALIRRAQAQISGQAPPSESGPNQTDFSELKGTATVNNGVIHNQDLTAKSPLLRVEGRGRVDLPAETLDYLVTAKVVGSLEGQGGGGLADLRGISIPVQVSGPFSKPAYKVKLDKAVQESAEKKLKKKLEKKLEKKFGDQFKGLFK